MYKNKDQECGVEDRSFISKSVKLYILHFLYMYVYSCSIVH